MDYCYCVSGSSEDDFFQLGWGGDLDKLRIDFANKLGVKKLRM